MFCLSFRCGCCAFCWFCLLSCVELKNANYTLKSWHFRLFRIAETKTECFVRRAPSAPTYRIYKNNTSKITCSWEVHWNECVRVLLLLVRCWHRCLLCSTRLHVRTNSHRRCYLWEFAIIFFCYLAFVRMEKKNTSFNCAARVCLCCTEYAAPLLCGGLSGRQTASCCFFLLRFQ